MFHVEHLCGKIFCIVESGSGALRGQAQGDRDRKPLSIPTAKSLGLNCLAPPLKSAASRIVPDEVPLQSAALPAPYRAAADVNSSFPPSQFPSRAWRGIS